jgi:NADH-quinone oxidoreductase subunit E
MKYVYNPVHTDKALAMELLSDETRAIIDQWRAKFPPEQPRSALLRGLHAAQDQNGGWLSEPLIEAVCQYLEIPATWGFEAATFYSMYFTKPCGRHKVAICSNISCKLRGADAVIQHVQEKLGISLGETTEDGRITLVREEECLAACAGAPMMIVDGHYHEQLTIEKVDQILDSLK